MPLKSKITRFCAGLTLFAFILYPFSHLPEMGFGRFTVSPIQLVEMALVVVTGILYAVDRQTRTAVNKLIKQNRRFGWALSGFLALVILSQLWSGSTRGIYTTSLLTLGIGFGGAVFYWLNKTRLPVPKLGRLIIIAGIGLSAFTLFQFVGDNLEWPAWLTKSLGTADWRQIDFSRVNGFSEEPQYLTTVLLLPAALLYSRFALKRHQVIGFLLIDMAVFLSLSRGGFLAHGLLGLFWLAAWAQQKDWRALGGRLTIAASALILTFGLIAWSGTLPGHKGGEWVVRRYVEQASGGLLPVHTRYVNSLNAKDTAPSNRTEQLTNPLADNDPVSNRDEVGVVEESALGRLETYKLALEVWNENWKNRLVGVGWGNFGEHARGYKPDLYGPLSIVNNQPLQVLVELGLIGVLAAAIVILSLVRVFRATATRTRRLAASLLIGLAVQMQFFSALHLPHVWITLALLLYFAATEPKSKSA